MIRAPPKTPCERAQRLASNLAEKATRKGLKYASDLQNVKPIRQHFQQNVKERLRKAERLELQLNMCCCCFR